MAQRQIIAFILIKNYWYPSSKIRPDMVRSRCGGRWWLFKKNWWLGISSIGLILLLYQPKLALNNLFNSRLARNYLNGFYFPFDSTLGNFLNWALNLVTLASDYKKTEACIRSDAVTITSVTDTKAIEKKINRYVLRQI